ITRLILHCGDRYGTAQPPGGRFGIVSALVGRRSAWNLSHPWLGAAPWLTVLFSSVLAAAPVHAKHTATMAPSGAATWPQLLRRDPAVIKALGGRRRAVPFHSGPGPRGVGGGPARPASAAPEPSAAAP